MQYSLGKTKIIRLKNSGFDWKPPAVALKPIKLIRNHTKKKLPTAKVLENDVFGREDMGGV